MENKKIEVDLTKVRDHNPAGDNLYQELFKVLDVDKAVSNLNTKGKEIFDKTKDGNRPAKTTINYLPSAFAVILEGVGYCKILDLIHQDPKQVFKNVQFIFRIAAYGSSTNPIYNIGDLIDIRSTDAVSYRPMFYNKNSILKWQNYFRNNKELVRASAISDKNRFHGKVILPGDIEPKGDIGAKGDKKLFTGQETVEVTEYFLTEDHNIFGVYGI